MRITPSKLSATASLPPRGFALRDLASTIAFAGLALALISAGMPRFRSGALLAECINKQRNISASNTAYALSNQDNFVGLNWLPGNTSSGFADLRAQAQLSPSSAHAAQAVDLWRRHGRLDIAPINFFPDSLYANIPLVDFLGLDLTDPFNVCPADANRLAWRADPVAFDHGAFLPLQPLGGQSSPTNKRWPYSSSYIYTASAFDRLQSDPNAPTEFRLSQQGGSENVIATTGNSALGPSRMSLVAFPSAKVFFFDHADRHIAPQATHYAIPGATLPAAFFDASVRVVRADDANTPWQPRTPASPDPSQYTYTPNAWDPLAGVPPPPPFGSILLSDPFRYTRDGLLGIDFPPLRRIFNANSPRTPG